MGPWTRAMLIALVVGGMLLPGWWVAGLVLLAFARQGLWKPSRSDPWIASSR